MAKNILSELVVQMTVESASFQKELEKAAAKQAAFKKSTESNSDALKDLDKMMGFASKAVIGFSAALAAVGFSQQRQRDIQNYARLTGVTADEFIKLSRAAKTVGIENEKLADISKDTLEKLGEFTATGGGGFKDFFEQVAPQVGLTADMLRGLSGPDVLIAVKKAMDDANISMEEQSFYLESIASDTTALLPLLAQEGKEFDKLSKKSVTVGDALSNFAAVAGQVVVDIDEKVSASNSFIMWLDSITEKINSVRTGEDTVQSLTNDISLLQQQIQSRALKGFPTDDLQEQLSILIDKLDFAKSKVSEKDIWGGLVSPEAQKRVDDQVDAFVSSIESRMEFAKNPFEPIMDNFQVTTETLSEGIDWTQIIKPDEAKAQTDLVKEDLSSLSSYISSTILSNMNIVTSGLSQMGEEASGFLKFLFAIQKAAAIPSMIVNTNEAYTKALTINPILAETVRASGYAAVGVAAGQSIAGVFHGGGAIPVGNHEQTYLLKGGEYVESRAERREIDRLIAAQNNTGETSVNLSYNIQALDAKGVKQVLLENNQTVYAAVESVMRRRGQRL